MRVAAWLNNISIFKKLMLSFMVLSLIPIVCIGVISYTLTYRTMHRDLSRTITINQQRIADQIAQGTTQRHPKLGIIGRKISVLTQKPHPRCRPDDAPHPDAARPCRQPVPCAMKRRCHQEADKLPHFFTPSREYAVLEACCMVCSGGFFYEFVNFF
jgi:hypothetical protein